MEWPGDFPEDQAFVELVVPEVSSDLDFELFLKDTDEKLSLSAISTEKQLKELQVKRVDSRTDDHPTDVLQHLNSRAQNNLRPIATGHHELMEFFRALQQYLKSDEEGKEEVTLELLMGLFAQCGVSFPCTPSSSSSTSSLHPQTTCPSAHMLHTVKDDSSLEIQEAWDAVRLQLRRYLMDRLSCHSPDRSETRQISTHIILERVYSLQRLLLVYPECEVLTDYQVLKHKYVMSVLHSSVCSSPGGETGFDRLVTTFCNAVPHLTQALTEEIQVLTRLTEPSKVLSFLNAAYFRTVAQELATQMEREFERAQRDNTTPSKKIKRYSVRSRAAVAPVELPVKTRSFSLTSHQLKVLTQLACILLGFESKVRELVTNMTFINYTEDSPCEKGKLKNIRKEDSNMAAEDRKPTSYKLYTPEVQTLEFNWRSAFSGLVPHMEHCVKVVLDDVCAKNLQQEEALHSSGCSSVSLSPITEFSVANKHLKEDFFCNYSDREKPKMIAKFCGAILIELDALLPLAVACRSSSLLGVRSSFVEACGKAAFAMLSRLQERALEVPSSAPLKNLPALLSTCIYVHQRLGYYSVRLKDSDATSAKVPLTLLPLQKYQEAIKAFKEQLTRYCIQVCMSSLFHDAESHNWADPKPFYEGERCSFSLQMWFYFLCGLRSDLWAVLPADLAKDVLGQLLKETLQLLVQRYARVRASYKRHLQIRSDITAILLYVEHLLWSVCESPESLVFIDPPSEITVKAVGSDWPSQIHSLCNQLLMILVAVTAPLSLVHRTFVINASEDSTSHQPESPVVRWLNAIKPDLYTERAIRDGLMGEAALACQLRLLTSDPECSPKLLLRMLLYEDCHLPRILLENSYFCQESGSEMSTENCKAGDNFIVALFNLFLCLNNVPKALTQALQPYLERAHVWQHVYSLADTTQTVPVVITCVREIVSKSTNSLLLHLVIRVLSRQVTGESRGAPFKHHTPESVLAKIPKDWNYKSFDERRMDSNTSIYFLIQALSFIFTNLPSAVASMPIPIRFLFQEAEKHLSQHSRQLRPMGLLLWALLGCLIQGLEDPNTHEQLSGLALDGGAKECLSLIGECLQAAMNIQQKGVPKLTVHKVLQALEEKRPKWINAQMQKARKLCADSVFEQGVERRAAAAELTEQKIGLILLEVCHKAGGSSYLRQIYHIIQGNEDILMRKLSGRTDVSNEPLVNFNVGPETPSCFNPLLQFDHIGKKKLDQSAVVDWTWDWPRLLPAYQGMSQVTFRGLVANRWDMQEGVELEDAESAMVEELQKAVFVCCCHKNPQDPPGTDETPTKPTQGETPASDKSAAQ
uniref:KIAA0825 n=1 Tax=Iconisemion striatum TaxID=60296 RepID=A0A1A7WWN9_9TELE